MENKNGKKIEQAGAELCQAKLILSQLAACKLVTCSLLGFNILDHTDAAYYTSLCLFSQLLLLNEFSKIEDGSAQFELVTLKLVAR